MLMRVSITKMQLKTAPRPMVDMMLTGMLMRSVSMRFARATESAEGSSSRTTGTMGLSHEHEQLKPLRRTLIRQPTHRASTGLLRFTPISTAVTVLGDVRGFSTRVVGLFGTTCARMKATAMIMNRIGTARRTSPRTAPVIPVIFFEWSSVGFRVCAITRRGYGLGLRFYYLQSNEQSKPCCSGDADSVGDDDCSAASVVSEVSNSSGKVGAYESGVTDEYWATGDDSS